MIALTGQFCARGPLFRLASSVANASQKTLYDRTPQACEGNDVMAVLPRQSFEHMKLPLAAGRFEGVKILAAVGNAIEGVVFSVEPRGRSGKCCSPPGDHGIDHPGCGALVINPAAHEIEDTEKELWSCARECQCKEATPGMPADQQALTINIGPRKQVLDNARHVQQRVLESRKCVLGIV